MVRKRRDKRYIRGWGINCLSAVTALLWLALLICGIGGVIYVKVKQVFYFGGFWHWAELGIIVFLYCRFYFVYYFLPKKEMMTGKVENGHLFCWGKQGDVLWKW